MNDPGVKVHVTQADLPTFADQLPVTQSAIRFARHMHRDQRRVSDGAWFIVHPLEVASLLYNVGCSDRVVAAGVLHDVVEDTSTVIGEIRQRFGGHIASLAFGSHRGSDDFRSPSSQGGSQRPGLSAGAEAATIFAADKVTKVRELRARIAQTQQAQEPSSVDIEDKHEHYSASLKMLERLIPDMAVTRQLRFELEALQTLPPQPI